MDRISPPFLTFLLNALWQIPVAAAIAAMACKLMPNGPARHRHGVWVAALAIALLLPLTSLPPQSAGLSQPAAPPIAGSPGTVPATLPDLSQMPPVPSTARTVTLSRTMAQVLVAAYLLFLLYRLARFAVVLYRTWTIRRDAVPISPSPELEAAIARCRGDFSLRHVRVLFSARVAGPVAAGAVILPRTILTETSSDVLMTAIGHEMAHIARHDFTLKLLYEVLSLPIAFHPATAWIRREIERTREMACDELVATRLLDAGVYARSIAAIAGAIGPSRPGIMPGVFDGDILEERIRRLIEHRGGDPGRARAALAGGLVALAICSALAGGLAISAVQGQSSTYTFEVASVKPATPLGPMGMRAARRGGPGTSDPGMYTCTNCPISWILSEGYDLLPFEWVAPDWLDTARFDFLAKIPAGTTKEDFRIMLQHLLADRFKLVVHRGKKEMKVYELTIAKNGPKFQESVPPAAPDDDGPVELKRDKDGFPILPRRMSMAIVPGHAAIRSSNQPISWFARTLAAQFHGPVIDATGLKAKYDFLLSWAFEDGDTTVAPPAGEASAPLLAPYLPALIYSIQSQLGLKVEQKKRRVEVLFVDHIEKQPSGN